MSYAYQIGSDKKTNWRCLMNCQYLSHIPSKSVGSTILGTKVLGDGGAGVRARSLVFAPA